MTKEKIAIIAGCSHSAGSEIDGELDSSYNRDNAFGSLLANNLGYRPVNIAINGSSNTGIARSILMWFDENYDPNTMDVYVIVGWTESSRLEIPAKHRPSDFHSGNPSIQWYDSSANSYLRINYGWEGNDKFEKSIVPKYHEFMAENETYLEYQAASNVLLIQYYLKSLNVSYIMCNTMHMFVPNDHYVSYLLKMIDKKCYYNYDEGQDSSFYWKYRNLGFENSKAKYWHHSKEPHRLYAEELYKFIGEQNEMD
jgi:hypothetical protein